MQYPKWFNIVMIAMLFLLLSNSSMAYRPLEDETIAKIASLSDTFLHGVIIDITYSDQGRPVTINKLKVNTIYFDKHSGVKVGDEIDIITKGGVLTKTGQRIKALNAPEFVKGSIYIIYLRWNPSQNVFTPTSGESSVFEVDGENKILNIHGHYILDIQNDKLIVGPSKTPKASDTQETETPPTAVVKDIHGNTTTQPQIPSMKAQSISLERFLGLQEFLEKVPGDQE